jgi:hypothetical protein
MFQALGIGQHLYLDLGPLDFPEPEPKYPSAKVSKFVDLFQRKGVVWKKDDALIAKISSL